MANVEHAQSEISSLAARLGGDCEREIATAADALAAIGGREACAILAAALLSRSTKDFSRLAAAMALGEAGGQEHLGAFVAVLREHEFGTLHTGVLFAMTHLDCSEEVPLLCEFVVSGERAAVDHAIQAMQELDPLGFVCAADLARARAILDAGVPHEEWRTRAITIAQRLVRRASKRVVLH